MSNPEDRAEECQGLMKQISLLRKNSQLVAEFKYINCGIVKTNKISEGDNLTIFVNNLKYLFIPKHNFCVN